MSLYDLQGSPIGLEAVVPGFRSIEGIGLVGTQTPAAPSTWPASVEELIKRITAEPTNPAPDNLGMRWGFFTVAAALLGVFVVYQELRHK